jgi:hypothetical protein
MESPLFRLLAELRDQIWTFAFGNRIIHPRVVHPDPKQETVWGISFDFCNEPFMDGEVYVFNLDKQSALKSPRWRDAVTQARATDIVIGLHTSCKRLDSTFSLIVPLVSKQVYYEAVPIAWKTSTFWFGDASELTSFLNAPVARIDLISQLSLHMDNWRPPWHDALKSSAAISRLNWLKALRGLNLVYNWNRRLIPSNEPDRQMHTGTITGMVREFGRMPLEKDRTTVFVYCLPEQCFSAGRRFECADEVRKFLLNQS